MQDASGAFQKDKLNKGKVHGRRALEEIRSFKQGLEQAAQQGAGGKGPKIPLPFGARKPQGSGKGGKASNKIAKMLSYHRGKRADALSGTIFLKLPNKRHRKAMKRRLGNTTRS